MVRVRVKVGVRVGVGWGGVGWGEVGWGDLFLAEDQSRSGLDRVSFCSLLLFLFF